METTFPEVIDNTMRKEWVKCPKAVHYRHEMGLEAPGETRVDLHAGKAFAHGMYVMRVDYFVGKVKAKTAIDNGILACNAAYGDFKPDKATTKTKERMAGALAYLAAQQKLGEDDFIPLVLPNGKSMLEFQFLEELPILHPVTGNALKYAGRFDMLARNRHNGEIWVVDEKTTKDMGEKWANQWLMDSQMTGYIWGAEQFLKRWGVNEPVQGAVINGVAIRKYDYEVQRFPVTRADWEVSRWFDQMIRDVQNWKRAFLAQDHNMNLDHACAYYNNPCQFVPLCKARNPERLYDSFVVRRWDPTNPD